MSWIGWIHEYVASVKVAVPEMCTSQRAIDGEKMFEQLEISFEGIDLSLTCWLIEPGAA